MLRAINSVVWTKMKSASLGLIIIVGIGLFLFQFDFTKRLIASYNHKISVPSYMILLKLHGIRGQLLFDSEPRTQGLISKDAIIKFYHDINGEQVVINSQAIGSIKDLDLSNTTEFSIIYRNEDHNLNGVNLWRGTEDKYYWIEIQSNYE